MSEAFVNIDKPGVRCEQCGGRTRVCDDPIYRRGARILECVGRGQKYSFKGAGPCSWTSLNPARVDPSWYWRLRVFIGR